MKKYFIVSLFAATLISCGGESEKSEDKKDDKSSSLSDIKDKCDCVTQVGAIADQTLEEAENTDDMDALKSKTIKEVQAVMKHCNEELKVSRSDLKSCDGYDEVDAKMTELNRL